MTRHIKNIGTLAVSGRCDGCGKHRELESCDVKIRYPVFGFAQEAMGIEKRYLCKNCASMMCPQSMGSLSDLHEQLGRQL